MKQAQPMPVLRTGMAHRRIARTALSAVVATLFLTGARANRARADPLAVPPASPSWERFTPTLELPRIYNPDGSLPPDAEMPTTVAPDTSPAGDLPAPDAAEPASASAPSASGPAVTPDAAGRSSASVPSASGPAVTRGDPPTGDAHDATAAQPATKDDDQSADDASLPEPDPESELSAPSALDPSEGIDTPGGNAVGSAQDYQDEQVDAPSVVLLPPPYYGPPQPIYGYPYYGPVLGRYPYFGPGYSHPFPPSIPSNPGFGAMPPPAYHWIGSSPPWSSSMQSVRASHFQHRSFPIH